MSQQPATILKLHKRGTRQRRTGHFSQEKRVPSGILVIAGART
jgi:hypothetical protein